MKEEIYKFTKLKDEIEAEKEKLKKEREEFEEEKKKFKEEQEKQEEEKLKLKEEKEKYEETKRKIKEEKEKQEEEWRKIKEEKDKQDEDRKRLREEREKFDEEKRKMDIMDTERRKKEEERKRLEFIKNNAKIESFGNSQTEQMSYINRNNNNRDSDNSNLIKKNTYRDSEILEQEFIEVNDSKNNDVISVENKNNYIAEEIVDTKNNNNNHNDININDYQKINDKEVSNKIKYELQQDLLNKQKKSYNMMILTELRNKPDNEKGYKINNKKNDDVNINTLDINNEKNRKKLTLFDLENKKDKNIKEIDKLLKGGVDDNKIMKLENSYKYNKDIMNIINNYKNKKMTLEHNNLIEEESSSNSLKIININRAHKPRLNKDKNDNNKNKVRAKSGKGLCHSNSCYSNYFNQNQSTSSIKEFCDLSPFYYISNGNKLSKNMWGYNEYRNNNMNYDFPTFNTNINNSITNDQIIQNKLRIYKDMIYKPFLEKVEKEKLNEYRRIQILKKIHDPNIKNNLETKFGIDRGKIDLQLTKEKEKIKKAIREYEAQLILNENENKKILEHNNIFFE